MDTGWFSASGGLLGKLMFAYALQVKNFLIENSM